GDRRVAAGVDLGSRPRVGRDTVEPPVERVVDHTTHVGDDVVHGPVRTRGDLRVGAGFAEVTGQTGDPLPAGRVRICNFAHAPSVGSTECRRRDSNSHFQVPKTCPSTNWGTPASRLIMGLV